MSSDFDDYDVEDERPGLEQNKTAAAVAAALRLGTDTDAARKKRKAVPKLDFERLMGQRGFRMLRQKASELNFSNHTEVDLKMIMRLYQEWADFMFPKLPFKDVLRRIDRLSKAHRSLKIYVRALQEAQATGTEFDEAAFLTGMALEETNVLLEERLWNALGLIPEGKFTTYKELARFLKTAPRAVGQALRRNPRPIIVPCHRVVCSNLSLGGYCGKMNSAEKIRLLEKEGVRIDQNGVVIDKNKMYIFE